MYKSMSLEDFMAMGVQHHRDHVVRAFAGAFNEPCPVCECTHYLGDAMGIPHYDEEEDVSYISEFMLFVCAQCGAVFYTDNLVMHTDTRITGKLERVTEDDEFVAIVQDNAGYDRPY